VYQTAPPGSGATSCGALPEGTANESNDADCACTEPIANMASTRTDAKYRKNRDVKILFTVAEAVAFAMWITFASVTSIALPTVVSLLWR
jgi:Cft2 family RNA processing exonuclease